MGKDFVLRSSDWGGNGTTGGKFKFASKVSTGLKVGGFALAGYNAVKINQQFNAGQISGSRMAIEQTSNVVSTFGILGAAWGIGWETGRAITNIPGYHQNVRLPLQRMLGIIPAAPKPYECVLCPK